MMESRLLINNRQGQDIKQNNMLKKNLLTCPTGNSIEKVDGFKYCDERFADIEMLRYKVDGFETLTLRQKIFIYYLQEAALWGRDILFDQNGRYNLEIRTFLERLYTG